MNMQEYRDEDYKYPWAPFEEVEEIIPRKTNLSLPLRRFLSVYSKINDPVEMYRIHTDDDRNETWGQRRDNTIARLLPRYLNNPSQDGKLTLELWAYDVDKWNGGY